MTTEHAIRLPEGVKLPDGTYWEGHHVSLERFEGPLDLLLFLVREHRIEIADIRIAEITDQFLAHVRSLEDAAATSDENLDVTGDFLVMAATLVQIKLRELLPREEQEALEDEELTRADLIRLLEEYERFKAAAQQLDERKRERERIFIRRTPLVEPSQEEILKVDLTRLLEAFRKVLKNAPQERIHELARVTVRIEDCMDAIVARLEREGSVLFDELFPQGQTKSTIIATFLALLELMKLGEVTVSQSEATEPIRIIFTEAAKAARQEA